MAIRYCNLCQFNVELKRIFGGGSIIAVLLTAGLWLFVLPSVATPQVPTPKEFAKPTYDFDTFLYKPGGEGVLRLMGSQTRKGPIPRASVAVTEYSVPGTTKLPALHASPDDSCGGPGVKKACTEAELTAQAQIIALAWTDLPEVYRSKCVSTDTFGSIYRCISEQKLEFLSRHMGQDLGELAKANPWLYNYDEHGGHINPAPGPLFLPDPIVAPKPIMTQAAPKAAPVAAQPMTAQRTPDPDDNVELVAFQILIQKYQMNEIAADREYKGRKLVVYGPVSSVNKDMFDDAYVNIGPPFTDIRAEFGKSQEDALVHLHRGGMIIFSGTVRGLVIGSVLMTDCHVKRP